MSTEQQETRDPVEDAKEIYEWLYRKDLELRIDLAAIQQKIEQDLMLNDNSSEEIEFEDRGESAQKAENKNVGIEEEEDIPFEEIKSNKDDTPENMRGLRPAYGAKKTTSIIDGEQEEFSDGGIVAPVRKPLQPARQYPPEYKPNRGQDDAIVNQFPDNFHGTVNGRSNTASKHMNVGTRGYTSKVGKRGDGINAQTGLRGYAENSQGQEQALNGGILHGRQRQSGTSSLQSNGRIESGRMKVGDRAGAQTFRGYVNKKSVKQVGMTAAATAIAASGGILSAKDVRATTAESIGRIGGSGTSGTGPGIPGYTRRNTDITGYGAGISGGISSPNNARFAQAIFRQTKQRRRNMDRILAEEKGKLWQGNASETHAVLADEVGLAKLKERYRTTQDFLDIQSERMIANSRRLRQGQAPMPGYNAIRPQYDTGRGYYGAGGEYYRNLYGSNGIGIDAYSVGGSIGGMARGAYTIGRYDSREYDIESIGTQGAGDASGHGQARQTGRKENKKTASIVEGGGDGIFAEETRQRNVTSAISKRLEEQNRADTILRQELEQRKNTISQITSSHIRSTEDMEDETFGSENLKRKGENGSAKLNTKSDTLMGQNNLSVTAGKMKNMKVLSTAVSAMVPGAAIAGGATGVAGQAGKVAGTNTRSVYNAKHQNGQNNPDEPDNFEEGGKKKKKKQKKKQPQKMVRRVSAGVMAAMIGGLSIFGGGSGTAIYLTTAPSMANTLMDSTGENQDSVTQAAYAMIKSRFEAMKVKIAYGEDYEFEDTSDDSLGSGMDAGGSLADMTPWQGTKYNLTEDQIVKMAYVCAREQESEDGVIFEIDQALNLFELRKHNSNATPYDMLRNDDWYGGPSRGVLTMDRHVRKNGVQINLTQTMIDSVRKAVNDGVRYLPLYVDEHDDPGDITSVTNGTLQDPVPNQTVISNQFGSTYTFYAKPESGDAFGYTDQAKQEAEALGWSDTGMNTYIGGSGSTSNVATNYAFATVGTSYDPNADGAYTTEQFLAKAEEVMEWIQKDWKNENPNDSDRKKKVYKNGEYTGKKKVFEHVAYGPTKSEVPGDDGYISGDSYISRVLYELGDTEQPSGGVSLANLDSHLTEIGWKKSRNIADVKQGSIVLVKKPGGNEWVHAFIALSYDSSSNTMDRYDAGSNKMLEQEQPVKSVPWTFDEENVAVFNWRSPEETVGYDASLNLPTIKCTKATIKNADGTVITLGKSEREKIEEDGVANYTYSVSTPGSTYLEKEVVDSVKMKDPDTGEEGDISLSLEDIDAAEASASVKANYTDSVDSAIIQQIKAIAHRGEDTELVFPASTVDKIQSYKSKHPLAVVTNYTSHMVTTPVFGNSLAATDGGSIPPEAGAKRGLVINPPSGVGTSFTYELWDRSGGSDGNGWADGTRQDKLNHEYLNFDEEGFGRIGDYYVVACTDTYGDVGDIIKFTYSNGGEIDCIIGDIKNQGDSGCTMYGHNGGSSAIEFMVNGYSDMSPVKWYANGGGNHANPSLSDFGLSGSLQKAENLGNVWVDGIQNLNSVEPVFTVKYISKQRGNSVDAGYKLKTGTWTETSEGDVDNEAATGSSNHLYKMYTPNKAVDTKLYYDEDAYFKMLMNTLTIGTKNIDARDTLPKPVEEESEESESSTETTSSSSSAEEDAPTELADDTRNTVIVKDLIDYAQKADPDCFPAENEESTEEGTVEEAKPKKVKLKDGYKRIDQPTIFNSHGAKGLRLDEPLIGQTGNHCGPTSMAMVMAYMENCQKGQYKVSAYNETEWYNTYGHGNSGYQKKANENGYKFSTMSPTSANAEKAMQKHLSRGFPFIMSFNSGYTRFAGGGGHFITIYGFVNVGGKTYYYVNDPVQGRRKDMDAVVKATISAKVGKAMAEEICGGRQLYTLDQFTNPGNGKANGLYFFEPKDGSDFLDASGLITGFAGGGYGENDKMSFYHLNKEDEAARVDAILQKRENGEEEVVNEGDAQAVLDQTGVDVTTDEIAMTYQEIDNVASYLAKMGYLQYACDLLDASFKAVEERGFEVEYSVESTGTSRSTREGNSITVSPNMKLQANITLYVDASPEDITEKIKKVGDTDWTYSDISMIYNDYMATDEVYSSAYNVSNIYALNDQLGGTGGLLTGNARKIYKYFHKKGLSDYAISGILGNMAMDSGDETLEGITAGDEDDGYVMLLACLEDDPERREALEEYALRRSEGKLDMETQLDFIWEEMFVNETGNESIQMQYRDGENHYSVWGDAKNSFGFTNVTTPSDAAERFFACGILNASVDDVAERGGAENPNDNNNSAEIAQGYKTAYEKRYVKGYMLEEVRIPEAERAYELITGKGESGSSDDIIATAEMFASDERVGYSQATRNFVNNGGDNLDVDCSSFVYYVLYYSGYLPNVSGTDPFCTANMGGVLLDNGWEQINPSQAQAGDVMVTPGSHTEIVVGDGKSIGAHSDNDGRPGDGKGTGHGTDVNTGNMYQGSTCYRYAGGTPTPIELPIKLNKDQDP